MEILHLCPKLITNKIKMKTKISLSIIALIIIVACGTQTKVTGIWKDSEYKAEDFNKIAVIGITSNIANRDIFENALVKKLKEIGYNAVPGSVIITPSMIKLKDKQSLKKALKINSVDGALVISLLDIKEESYYVAGSSAYYQPIGPYYGSFYDYYYYNYDRVYAQGYYESTIQIFLESNFYSLISDTLVQTTQTETFNPADVRDLADSYSKTIIEQLVTGKILKNKVLIEKKEAEAKAKAKE
jgi:hypothetical protein